jgi:hypothetical protein
MVTGTARGGRHPMRIPPADSSTADLLKAVTKAGVRFRLMGCQIRVTGQASLELRPVLNALKGRRGSQQYGDYHRS